MVKKMTELKKPFWQYPPYIILFDLLRLHRIRPWDVNVSVILNSFLVKMKEQGGIDFYASGIALLSSATIHRIKSELVLKMEEPPKPPRPKPNDFVPPPIPTPIRFQYTSTTIKDVLESLEEIMSKNLAQNSNLSNQVLETPSIVEQLDEFLVNVEEHISEFYKELKKYSKKEKAILFSKITKDLTKLEKIRRFISLLFLATEKKIEVSQIEESCDIRIFIRD
jgi:segregation and condensation protein A